MNIRGILRYIIPAVGTIHFGIALIWWYLILFRVLGLEAIGALPANFILLVIVFPLATCLILLAGFAVALHYTDRKSRFAHSLTVGIIGIACVLFTLGATSSAAQVHVFGRPGLNHFYATWWLYSQFPPLSMGARALGAVTTFVAAVFLLKHGHLDHGTCRSTMDGC